MTDDVDLHSGQQADRRELAAEIVSAYVANNSLQPSELPGLLRSVYATLGQLGQPSEATEAAPEKPTAAQIRKSVTPDALISFIDGKPYKTLKRHLSTHGLDLAAYKARYGLPSDYPSTAPNYSAARSALARNLGLGRKRNEEAEASPPAPADAVPKRRGRAKKAAE